MRPRRAPEPSRLFEAELRIHHVSKNNARRFRFITEKQSCSLIQERFGEGRLSFDPSYNGFLFIVAERVGLLVGPYTHPAPARKKCLKDRPFFVGGEGGIRTHVEAKSNQ
jgi:hypothetical protein